VPQEQLDEVGLTDEQPVESYIHYTIGEDQRFLYSTEWTVAEESLTPQRRLSSYAGIGTRNWQLTI
jgi:hypothetical protein